VQFVRRGDSGEGIDGVSLPAVRIDPDRPVREMPGPERPLYLSRVRLRGAV